MVSRWSAWDFLTRGGLDAAWIRDIELIVPAVLGLPWTLVTYYVKSKDVINSLDGSSSIFLAVESFLLKWLFKRMPALCAELSPPSFWESSDFDLLLRGESQNTRLFPIELCLTLRKVSDTDSNIFLFFSSYLGGCSSFGCFFGPNKLARPSPNPPLAL